MEVFSKTKSPVLNNLPDSEIGSKSVLKPSAQSIKVCDVGGIVEGSVESLYMLVDKLKILNESLAMIMIIQFEYGVRISEVLSIKHIYINKIGGFKLRGSKGSNNRYIYNRYIASFMMRCKSRSVDPFEGISRFQVYRRYRKLGLSKKFGNNINSSVTHLGRHIYAENVNSSMGNIEDTAIQIGHKSSNSTKHYVNKNPK